MTEPLEGRVALITGAGSGIGRATALAMAKAGAKVAAADVNGDTCTETVKMIKDAGGSALAITGDVSDAASVADMVGKTVKEFGRLDIGMNNAGIGGMLARTHDYDEATFDSVIAVTLKGVWLCMRAELRQMMDQGGGVILNMASVAGLIGAPMLSAYVAAKHGVVGLTKTAALEYARKNIRVNALCPVWVQTALVDQITGGDEGREQKLIEHIPLRRLGQPEEVAAAAVWLCSDAASFITGACLPLDGGTTAG